MKYLFFVIVFLAGFTTYAQVSISYFVPAAIGVSTNPEKPIWGEFRMGNQTAGLLSSFIAGLSGAGGAIGQAESGLYLFFNVATHEKVRVYLGPGFTIAGLISNTELSYSTVRVPVGMQIAVTEKIPNLYLNLEAGSALLFGNGTEGADTFFKGNLGLRYVLAKE